MTDVRTVADYDSPTQIGTDTISRGLRESYCGTGYNIYIQADNSLPYKRHGND